MDFHFQITQIAALEFPLAFVMLHCRYIREWKGDERGAKKCIHLCNLPSANNLFLRYRCDTVIVVLHCMKMENSFIFIFGEEFSFLVLIFSLLSLLITSFSDSNFLLFSVFSLFFSLYVRWCVFNTHRENW